jgi:hypothetical protein
VLAPKAAHPNVNVIATSCFSSNAAPEQAADHRLELLDAAARSGSLRTSALSWLKLFLSIQPNIPAPIVELR